MFEGNVCSFYGSMFIYDRRAESSSYPDWLPANDSEIAQEYKELLDIYHHSFNDDNIDIDLLMTILHEVHSSQDKGKSK
jgi:hypothetical protein